MLGRIPWFCVALLLSAGALAAQTEPTLQGPAVSQFFGSYDPGQKRPGYPSRALRRDDTTPWLFEPRKSDAPVLRIGVLLPNSPQNDPAWQPVITGMTEEAARNSVQLLLRVSDGYDAVDQHRGQFSDLVAEKPDAIILASIHYRAMDDLIAAASKSQPGPIIGLVNDIFAPAISGKAMVSFTDMGQAVGAYVKQNAQSRSMDKIRVAFFPGPINAGFAPDSLYGFVDELRDFPGEFELIEPQWGATEPGVQRALVEEMLSTYSRVDYIVGNGVAAVEAAKLLETMGLADEIMVLSTYASPPVRQMLEQGRIAAAPSDRGAVLGQLAIQLTLQKIADPAGNAPFRIAPHVVLCTQQTLRSQMGTHC